MSSYCNGEREENNFSGACDFLFAIETCKAIWTINRQNVALYIRIEKKKEFFAKLQTKM